MIVKSQGAAITSFTKASSLNSPLLLVYQHLSSRQWANQIISSFPTTLNLGDTHQLLTSDLDLLECASKQYLSRRSVDPRLARPLLYLIGYIASSIYLIEQASWSHQTREEEGNGEVDRVVVVRWVEAGPARETSKSIKQVLSADEETRRRERRMDGAIVYAKTRNSKL